MPSIDGIYAAIDDTPARDEPPHVTILRELMTQRGMSARALEAKAGLGRDGVKNIWRGRAASPRAKTMMAIADALGVPVAVLYGQEAAPPPPWRGPKPPRRSMLATHTSDPDADAPRAAPPGGAVIRVSDLYREGGASLTDPLRLADRSLVLPTAWVESLASDPGALVAVVVREAAGPEIPPGAWLLVDTAAGVRRGTYILHDGWGHTVARIARGADGAATATFVVGKPVPLDGYAVCGRVVGRLAAV